MVTTLVLGWPAFKQEGIVPREYRPVKWLSIGGASVLLAYAIWRADPVFILGQSLGFFIYARNLWLIREEGKRARQLGSVPGADAGGSAKG